jgi:Tol biopolymer transport system component
VYINGGRLTFEGADGGAARVLAPTLAAIGIPAWSPDGRTIAVWSSAKVDLPEYAGTQLFTVDVASGSARAVSRVYVGFPPADPPQWSPDGRSIAYHWASESGVSFIRQDGGAVTTADGEVTVPIGAIGSIVVTGVAWAPDGSKLLVAYHPYEAPSQPLLATFDPTTQALTPVAASLPAATTGWVAWSPHGQHVAINLTIGSRTLVAVLRPDGSDVLVLDADSPASDVLAGWSPDSTRLLVTRGERGLQPTSVWSLGIDAAGDARQESPAGMDAFDPSWQALPAA